MGDILLTHICCAETKQPPLGGHFDDLRPKKNAPCWKLNCVRPPPSQKGIDVLKQKIKGYEGFPKIGVPQNGWFIKENPIKMDDLGVSLFLETSEN